MQEPRTSLGQGRTTLERKAAEDGNPSKRRVLKKQQCLRSSRESGRTRRDRALGYIREQVNRPGFRDRRLRKALAIRRRESSLIFSQLSFHAPG